MNTESENLTNRDNQQERSRPSVGKSPETTRQAPKKKLTKAYLLGLLHDATETKYTFRIAQNNREFTKTIQNGILALGYKAWVYKEGKNRNVFVTEFSKKLLDEFVIKTLEDKKDYIRGYFDAEGGIAKNANVRFYLYFAQKNLNDLREVKRYLSDINIQCGKTHNPSKRVDPHYWRFYIGISSHKRFAKEIGSLHPVKSEILRMKI